MVIHICKPLLGSKWSAHSLGFWKQEFKNPSLRKVGVKIKKQEFDLEKLEFSAKYENLIFKDIEMTTSFFSIVNLDHWVSGKDPKAFGA